MQFFVCCWKKKRKIASCGGLEFLRNSLQIIIIAIESRSINAGEGFLYEGTAHSTASIAFRSVKSS